MKFLKRLFQKKSNGPYELLQDFLNQYQSKSGTAVNHVTALRATTALACARVIGEGIAQVPLKVYRELPDGGREQVREHPLYDILAIKPNDYQTSYDWRETMGLHLVFAGGAFAFINRVRGDISELLPFEPHDVKVKRTKGVLTYSLRNSEGGWVQVDATDILHLRGPSWNGWSGLDGVDLAREAIGLSIATEEHGAALFKNGATPGGILTSDAINLQKDQRDAIKASWEDLHKGSGNAHKTAILWGGLKWLSTAQQNDQAQYLETRGFQVEEVCRAFRVLPTMVGHSDKAATYASVEQMFLAHVVHTMGPWYARLEQSFDTQLLSEEDRQNGYYTKFTVAGLLRGAHKERSEYYAKALGSGGSPAWMTQDEVRALEDLNPVGGSAEQLPVASNVGGTVSDE
ncbi:MAG: phage portal protein [Candidatus Thiodiazotropha lotti]|nr:phage portal protein [Candidatus Thiodiazotropha lotti]